MSRYHRSKTNLDFTEARDSEWQWHQLCHMQICTSLQTDNQASTPPLSFLQTECPSYRPTNSVKALKAPSIGEPVHPKQYRGTSDITAKKTMAVTYASRCRHIWRLVAKSQLGVDITASSIDCSTVYRQPPVTHYNYHYAHLTACFPGKPG